MNNDYTNNTNQSTVKIARQKRIIIEKHRVISMATDISWVVCASQELSNVCLINNNLKTMQTQLQVLIILIIMKKNNINGYNNGNKK